MVKQIKNQEEFQKEIIGSDKLCIVDFFATWCEPCNKLAPVVGAVSEIEDFREIVNFYKVDIDGNEGLAIKYQVEVVPTLVFFKNGNVIKTEAGYRSKEELEEVIKKEVYKRVS